MVGALLAAHAQVHPRLGQQDVLTRAPSLASISSLPDAILFIAILFFFDLPFPALAGIPFLVQVGILDVDLAELYSLSVGPGDGRPGGVVCTIVED